MPAKKNQPVKATKSEQIPSSFYIIGWLFAGFGGFGSIVVLLMVFAFSQFAEEIGMFMNEATSIINGEMADFPGVDMVSFLFNNFQAILIAEGFSALLMLIAGIGFLNRKEWGLKLAEILLWLGAAFAVAAFAYSIYIYFDIRAFISQEELPSTFGVMYFVNVLTNTLIYVVPIGLMINSLKKESLQKLFKSEK